MFGSIGMPEMVIIFVIILIIFGPRKLPELGRSLGKSLSEFKKASNELRSTLEEEIRLEDQKDATKATAQVSAPNPVVARSAPVAPNSEEQVAQPTPVGAGTTHDTTA
jgi:TatA/E family protein of Tat protein translocase